MASRSWNRVELIGNLTRDPELRYTPSGAAVCTFSVATNRSYVTDGEKKEEVDFHRVVSWNKLAELCNQLLKKGNRVFVSGRLQTRSWDGQDGQTRNVTEIVLEDMIVLSPKGEYGTVASTAVEDATPSPKEEVASVVEEKPDLSEDKPARPAGGPKEKSSAPSEDISPDEDLPF